MRKNVVKEKTTKFALDIINLYKKLILKKEFVLSRQILRSGTSIGAMIRESEHAESKMDFIHKLSIAQKEANETLYWLELLVKSKFIEENYYNLLESNLIEIQKIITSIIISTKKNLKNNV